MNDDQFEILVCQAGHVVNDAHEEDKPGMPFIGQQEGRVREGGEELHEPRRSFDVEIFEVRGAV